MGLGGGCHWPSPTGWSLGVSWASKSIWNVQMTKKYHIHSKILTNTAAISYEQADLTRNYTRPLVCRRRGHRSLTTFPSTSCPNLYPHPNPCMFHLTSSLHLSCSRAVPVNLSLGLFTPCSLLIKSFCSFLIPATTYNVDHPPTRPIYLHSPWLFTSPY